jgi:hypothetical protein
MEGLVSRLARRPAFHAREFTTEDPAGTRLPWP